MSILADQRPEPASYPATAEEHAQLALYHARCARDMIGSDGRKYDPRFGSHMCVVEHPLSAAVNAGRPEMDQTEAP